MKKTIFAIIVLLLFIGLGIGEQFFVRATFDRIYEGVLEIRTLIEEDKLEEAHEKAMALQQSWSEKKHFAEAIISHNETKEITSRLSELEGYLAAKDDKSAIATAAITADLCKNLEHILAFTADTVF